MYVKTKIENTQRNLDLIATIMLESGHCYETATALVNTYYILKEDNKKIPNELYELIQASINYNNKNLYWLFILIQVSPSFRIGLTLKKLIYNILFYKKNTIYLLAQK